MKRGGLGTRFFTGVLLAGLLFIFTPAVSQATDVCGPVFADTAWTLAGSPYIVKCGIIVKPGITLTINPGVEVRFNGAYSIQVDGRLVAQGNSTDAITFTSNKPFPAAKDWGNIRFTTNSQGTMEYCRIEYAGYGDEGAVYINQTGPLTTLINHCTIAKCSGSYGAIYANNANNLQITNNTIRSNSDRGIFFGNGTANIAGNTINNNSASGIYAYGTAAVTGNTISNNTATYGGGIQAYSRVTITGNTISSNTAIYGGGIYCEDCTATNNTMTSNSATSQGGAIYNGGYSNISGNILRNNKAGEICGGIFVGYGSPTISGNNLLNIGAYEVYNNGGSDVDAIGNWWGTAAQSEIMDKIYDWYDAPSKGEVVFYPWLDSYNNLILIVSFIADKTQVITNEAISFTNLSAGDITGWLWKFGDGATSAAQNPIHSYAKAGDYTVSLTVTGPGGSDTLTFTDYIHVTEPVAIDVSLNKTSFVTGDTIKVTVHVTNSGPNPVPVEAKAWVVLPNKDKLSLVNPSHYTLTLAPGANIIQQIYSYPFSGSEPAGGYEVGGRLEDPVSGKDYGVDTEKCTFTP